MEQEKEENGDFSRGRLSISALVDVAAAAAQVSAAAAARSSRAARTRLPMPPETPHAAGEGRCSWFKKGRNSAGGLTVASGCSLTAARSLSGADNIC